MHVWKGDVPSRVVIQTNSNSASCGLRIGSGDTRMIYADQKGARLSTGLCSTPTGGGASTLTRILGEPHAPASRVLDSDDTASPDWVMFWGFGFLLDLFGLDGSR